MVSEQIAGLLLLAQWAVWPLVVPVVAALARPLSFGPALCIAADDVMELLSSCSGYTEAGGSACPLAMKMVAEKAG